MKNDMLDGLIALKLVAEKHSFTLAASELSISPSAISQTINRLEHRVGTALLKRTTRRTQLTNAGYHFLNQTAPAIDDIVDAIDDIANLTDQPSGTLRLNLPQQQHSSFIKQLLNGFSTAYPDITLALHFTDTEDAIPCWCDATIQAEDIISKDRQTLPIYGPLSHVVAGSPAYLYRYGYPETPEALFHHNCLCTCHHHQILDQWRFVRDGQERQIRVTGNRRMNDTRRLIDAAEQGHGLIYTPQDTIQESLNAGTLTMVLENYAYCSSGWYLSYPLDQAITPALQTLLDYIRTQRITSDAVHDY